MKRISEKNLAGRPRPTPRVIQFGEGNFLRAFMDWKIDRMNENAGTDFGVVVVRPIDGGIPFSLNDSDGVYSAITRGVDQNGEPVCDVHQVACIRQELSAVRDWQDVLALARNTDFQTVISNTTEAGITYVPNCRLQDEPPASFPAKITRLLLERFNSNGRTNAPGFQFLPCELIDKNGDNLEEIVMMHARDWGLLKEFTDWINSQSAFYNTLVDRIVPGYPRDEAKVLEAKLGYEDPLMVAAELFHFLVIEKREDQPELLLPLEKYDDGTLITSNADGYKERKVAILNGAHTGFCPLALLSQTETVQSAIDHPVGRAFLKDMLQEEIIPFLSLPTEELSAFSDEVLRRFANPYIKHRWYDISMNGIAKFQTRNLPRFESYTTTKGKPPRHMALSLAAWLIFYSGAFNHAVNLPARDASDVLERFEALKSIQEAKGTDTMIRAFLSEEAFWHKSIASDALVALVLEALAFLQAKPFTLDRLSEWTGTATA
ncbi:Altronate oxidoreductase [Pseudovibrio sp. Ad46]|uniref:tagaturonate reductase n=1 Tax=unclassified Pseudovibrio TaxID=2627060 RepID=UPI0007AE9055|nr:MULTISPECIES: tagaturonate reductase [unclassified Pseudovibrio]KZK88574.1 Altronate oxidoreductase [Pseudovibrio sp. Ad46]KZK91204.1 Altronate oxidoreductase [Pseudovibrio sp. Ad5]